MSPRFFVTLGFAGAFALGCEATSSHNPSTGGNGGGLAGSGGGSEASSSSSSGMGGGGPTACLMDADCANDPAGAYCDVSKGKCVACLPGSNACGQGKYCDPTTKQCADGCLDNADCNGMTPLCNVSTHMCAECLMDKDCPQGNICGNGVCYAGCSGQQPCAPGLSCCNSVCYDLSTDVINCGGCNTPCPSFPFANPVCVDSMCKMGACWDAFADCDQDPTNGCEWNVLQDGPCACVPGATRPCYYGAMGTENVGPCKGGTQTCNAAGTGWSTCVGQVLPKLELCTNGVDDDCSGQIDEPVDADGDGFPRCDGDCCDSTSEGCSNPRLINPGAFEVIGNGVDDDCNPATSDTVPIPDCSTAAKLTGVSALDVTRAIDLCQTTLPNPPLPQKKWGVISTTFLLANGAVPSLQQRTDMQNKQAAVLVNYGTGGIVPKKGPTMAGLSTGYMRDENDSGYPGKPDTDVGFTSMTAYNSTPPAAYLAAHMNALPSSAGCNGNCAAGAGANDPINLRLSIRVPTNALSLSYQFKYITYEYWMYSCTEYNDFYLALLESTAPGIPLDKNISFDSKNNPVSVNNGFFEICVKRGCYTCPAGYGELAGTGMQQFNYGGATKWLTTTAPIVPGETIQIEFMVFDVSDALLDSVVLIDNFQWGLTSEPVNTHD